MGAPSLQMAVHSGKYTEAGGATGQGLGTCLLYGNLGHIQGRFLGALGAGRLEEPGVG